MKECIGTRTAHTVVATWNEGMRFFTETHNTALLVSFCLFCCGLLGLLCNSQRWDGLEGTPRDGPREPHAKTLNGSECKQWRRKQIHSYYGDSPRKYHPDICPNRTHYPQQTYTNRCRCMLSVGLSLEEASWTRLMLTSLQQWHSVLRTLLRGMEGCPRPVSHTRRR